MENKNLRENQLRAVETSIENDFQSGVHFHATGTGKSWIALQLILEYNKRYPKNNIVWLCEQKSILIEQFHRDILRKKGYEDIYKKFMIINYVENKPGDWFSRINNAVIWNKPILVIINRSFLVSQDKYKKIKMNINLVIHDECHSIQNNTTQEFYNYLYSISNTVRCIGFSATPNLEIFPFNNVLSDYTIYDAFCDNIILPPKIKWIHNDRILTDSDYFYICYDNIKELYYKKIIIWCGIIEKCYELANLWKRLLPSFKIYVDTSKNTNDELNEYLSLEKNAILFCACKHREGSDIKNLDCCIFLDKVENRNSNTFVQCIGRVLRKDDNNNKKYGLILDLNASSCIKICDRMNEYLNSKTSFPWKYFYKERSICKKKIIEHTLLLKNSDIIYSKQKEYTLEDLTNLFVRECPNNQLYKNRLEYELNMINSKKLSSYLIRAVDILKLTDYIPHVTRGSCGSSLVCYLLGISNVDPVERNISFARFLNDYRNNLPDIDFDFPHYLRDEVFLKLELEWPNQVARISNHVHWHEKSALREALRKIGINKQIPKEDLKKFILDLPYDQQIEIERHCAELDNTFRYYSLHCGGIVFFHQGVPDDLKLNKKTLSQIIYNKEDVSNFKNFKIDILSSRGISQLIGIVGKNIDFNDCPYDEKTYQLLKDGDNIGITLAESPLMRKALMMIQPKSIEDLAVCLAIIRPAAKDVRKENNEIDYSTEFIFDDDAITLLSQNLNIDEDLADKFRRNISKNKWSKEDRETYDKLLNKLDNDKKEDLLSKLKNLRLYSFCKSHSYSYAQLVYKLAYQKAHNPKKFWKSTIKNVSSSYRKWVHLYEACRNGVDVDAYLNKSRNCSVYAEARKNKFLELDDTEQLKRYGYWNMKIDNFFPNCYFYKKDEEYLFGGLIASTRVISKKPTVIVCYIGVGKGQFIEIIIKNKYMNSKFYGVKGRATIKNEKEKTYNAHIAKFY